jgi:hypothetical protein
MSTCKRRVPKELYCFSCENKIFREDDNFGPICLGCFKKTKKRDLLSAAAIARVVVAIVPIVCPHDLETAHSKCRFGRATAAYFNVLVLDRNLEPTEITGPYTAKAAEKRAKTLRRRHRGKP